MNKNIINRLIIFNLIVAFIVILDLSLPDKIEQVKELDSIYNFTSNSGSARKPTYDFKTILLLKNGETFRIGKLPEKDYESGQKIKITKSIFFKNVNKVLIHETIWKEEYLGLFSNLYVLVLYILAVLFTILNIFIRNKILIMSLIASTMFITLISMVYIVYF